MSFCKTSYKCTGNEKKRKDDEFYREDDDVCILAESSM